jgi:hypothetical protein
MEEVVSQEELTEQENKIQGLNERNKRENEWTNINTGNPEWEECERNTFPIGNLNVSRMIKEAIIKEHKDELEKIKG